MPPPLFHYMESQLFHDGAQFFLKDSSSNIIYKIICDNDMDESSNSKVFCVI